MTAPTGSGRVARRSPATGSAASGLPRRETIEVEAGNDETVARQIEEGLAALDGSGPFGKLDADAQLEALTKTEGTPFFELLKATAVVELYDNPAVWKLLGYEGAAAHLGGYLHRGFDDLDWLPDPPLVMSADAGSHHQ